MIGFQPEANYLENMAASIYAASHRRVMSMIPAWHTLPAWRRDVFLAVAQRAIADIDAIATERVPPSSDSHRG